MSWNKKGEWLELLLPKPLESELDIGSYIRMPELFLKKLVNSGGVSIKGTRVRLKLFPNEPLQHMPVWSHLEVLYEDDFCLVVHKPEGMKVHGDGSWKGSEQMTLADAVAFYYESTGQQCKVRHIHRLDEDTTGPVLYAKHEWAQLIMDEAMRSKSIERCYAAIVQGHTDVSIGTIDAPIGKDRHHSSRRRVSMTGERAVTHYEVVEQLNQGMLVRLRLETGKTHQIRVHLSYLGHPIWGDSLYGGPSSGISRQALHGESLSFDHPLTGEHISVAAPWPEDFQRLYAALQKI
ncbi:23S rRNA pseudouridine1911/1915/1917 synthase [Paenibacillus sp. 1_12]|uniref:RluA family pseudouridine synthase n=1 Tax=Paenibacillus sp. 1_12 TaxID=1566278 RepID=UPI0008F34F05|nr:RluA family pseudouridine synthase [Paenibacillus sp. 1_12]SFK70164.1 23S rRNA pseudouridine1911/1915/1917 synthase [Paenibacillus sp. 1_12]